MGIYKDLLVKISGNAFVQRLMARQVHALNHAMGIGTSGDFSNDGEFVVFDLLRRNCQPPYRIFDVGANKGQFLTYVLGIMKQSSCDIHCFEPSHNTFGLLQSNFPVSANVTLNNIGLGMESCDAVLHYSEGGDEGASLTKRDLSHHGMIADHSENIRLTTLDEYCHSHDIEHIHLLKLDIEGHELDALTGARSMIDKGGIDIILFEFGGCNIDSRRFFRDYWNFFKDTAMSIYRATPSGYLLKIEKYCEAHEQFSYSNFIAIRNT